MQTTPPSSAHAIAFSGQTLVSAGSLFEVIHKSKAWLDQHSEKPVVIFDDETSRVVEVDFRGSSEEVWARLAQPGIAQAPSEPETRRGPGRPKLGVVAREVTLLPRHWEWLNDQPGGASVALRRLVEDARKTHADRDQKRQATEAVHRFMHAMAGDLPGFEEANRAFYAGEHERMKEIVAPWPEGIRTHALKLVARVG